MIYNNSNDPVLIKKIPLSVWTLRDKIEAVIQTRIENGQYTKDTKPSVEDLIAEYSTKKPLEKFVEPGEKSGLKLVPEEEGAESTEDNAEDEDAVEESVEAASEETSDEEKKEEAPSEPKEVIQRRPRLPADKLFSGTLILAELEMSHLYFFTNKQFTVGQSIVVEFLIPKKFSLNLDVAYCRAFNLKSRIISSQNFRYRVAAKFTFLKEGERTLLRQFIKSVEPDVKKYVPTKPIAVKSEDDDDGFGDLDDLDI